MRQARALRLRSLRPRSGQARQAFTLVELLVVVTIIVILIAILIPALDKAMAATLKAKCLVNQRTIVTACQQYAGEQNQFLPLYTMNGQVSSAYDMRTGSGGAALSLGLLPAAGFLPTTGLGKVIHCPLIDNSGAAAGVVGVGMDVIWSGGSVGGSWWVDPAYITYRVIPSYNYRAASWYNAGKGELKVHKVGSSDILTIDLPDMRFGGRQFIHNDGWNRVFADGHGSFFTDTAPQGQSWVERKIAAYAGEVAAGGGWFSGEAFNEEIYAYLASEKH